jgi:plasmid stabilization system protein ParE
MRILYVPEIINDLEDARNWYESCSNGLGEDFIHRTYSLFEELLLFPERHEKVYGCFRRALINRFPYSIYYHFSEDTIIIYGVFHSSRDPVQIIKRLGDRTI